MWSVADGKELKPIRCSREVFARHLCISRDGKRVLIVGSHQIVVWDLEQDRAVQEIPARPSTFNCGAFCGEDRFALTGSMAVKPGGEWDTKNWEINLWDLESGKEVSRFKGHTGMIKGSLRLRIDAVFSLALEKKDPAGRKSGQKPRG